LNVVALAARLVAYRAVLVGYERHINDFLFRSYPDVINA